MNNTIFIFNIQDLKIIQNLKIINSKTKILILEKNKKNFNKILKIIQISLKYLQKNYKLFNWNEPIGFEINDGSIESMIHSLYLLTKYKNVTIFDLLIQIFIRIICTHYISNGNKRFGIFVLKKLSIELGFYIKKII